MLKNFGKVKLIEYTHQMKYYATIKIHVIKWYFSQYNVQWNDVHNIIFNRMQTGYKYCPNSII